MRIELTQPAWKAGVLPLNYTRVKGVFTYLGFEFKCFYGGGGRIRTFERLRGQIYSLLPLTTRPPLQYFEASLLVDTI